MTVIADICLNENDIYIVAINIIDINILSKLPIDLFIAAS